MPNFVSALNFSLSSTFSINSSCSSISRCSSRMRYLYDISNGRPSKAVQYLIIRSKKGSHQGRPGVVYLVDYQYPPSEQTAMFECLAELRYQYLSFRTNPDVSGPTGFGLVMDGRLTVEKSSHCVLTTSLPTTSAICGASAESLTPSRNP